MKLLFVAGFLAWVVAVRAGQTTPTNSVRQYIVTLRAEADQDGCVHDHQLKRGRSYRHALNGFTAGLDEVAVQRLKKDQRVLAVEQDAPIRPAAEVISLPASTVIPGGVLRMGLTNFPPWVWWRNSQNYVDTDVAVLDTGIDNSSGELDVVDSVGLADPGYYGADWNGHGTHVAGIIGACSFGYGVVGVAPCVRLWDVQVLGPTQSTFANFIAGCDYVVSNADQIAVANASLEGLPSTNYPVIAVEIAVSNVVSHGVVFVAAAGNDTNDVYGADGVYGTADDILPASVPEALTVSAVNPWVEHSSTNYNDLEAFDAGTNADVIPKFSNYSRSVVTNAHVYSPGKAIDLAAPGVDIVSLYLDSQGAILSGTSMAAAHVSGLAALYIAINGRATNAEGVYKIRQALIDNALPQTQWRSYPNTGDPDGNPEPMAVASEAWVPKPEILSFNRSNNTSTLNFAFVPGYQYAAQRATSMTDSNWTDYAVVTNPYLGFASTTNITVSEAQTNASSFYRLVRQPAP